MNGNELHVLAIGGSPFDRPMYQPFGFQKSVRVWARPAAAVFWKSAC
jgi:hypothetical protein